MQGRTESISAESIPKINHLNDEWELKAPKPSNGKNKGGDLAGVYEHRDTHEKRLIKQDPVIAKNIIEFIAGRLLRLLAPEKPHIYADIKLFFTDSTSKPNENGDNVYVGSEWFNSLTELWKDAHNARNHLKIHASLREKDPKSRPSSRPKWIKNNPTDMLMLRTGRYNLTDIFVNNAFLDNMDLNKDNVAVIPAACTCTAMDKERGKICLHNKFKETPKKEKVYVKVDTVTYDFGGAFGDKRRKLDDHLHIFAVWRYIKPVSLFGIFGGDGPPNYLNTYPKELFYNKNFVRGLLKLSCFPPTLLKHGIAKIIDEVKLYFGPKPLLALAKRIGADSFMMTEKKCPLHAGMSADDLCIYITLFFQEKLCKRLVSAFENAKKIASEIGMNKDEFLALINEVKLARKKFFREHADIFSSINPNTTDYFFTELSESDSGEERDFATDSGSDADDEKEEEYEYEEDKREFNKFYPTGSGY